MSTARANTNMENTDEKVRMVLQCLNDPNLNDIRLPEGCEIENWQDTNSAATWEDLVTQAFGNHVKDWNSKRFLDTFVKTEMFDPNGFFFLKMDGKYVATAFAWISEHGAQVHWVGVLPQYRKRGLGTALVKLVLQHHRNKGWKSAYLDTEVDRVNAIALYTSMGFRIA